MVMGIFSSEKSKYKRNHLYIEKLKAGGRKLEEGIKFNTNKKGVIFYRKVVKGYTDLVGYQKSEITGEIVGNGESSVFYANIVLPTERQFIFDIVFHDEPFPQRSYKWNYSFKNREKNFGIITKTLRTKFVPEANSLERSWDMINSYVNSTVEVYDIGESYLAELTSGDGYFIIPKK
ncbi:hypothetical protein ACFFHF_16325 [Robertmurraya beringensis]|uniref:Uncharacterized protein n=1 Tax=Robertmurraya beringensis TaxID=641660 RepID=A0ABV6KTW4_9BACI